jgi:hypothetical protein
VSYLGDDPEVVEREAEKFVADHMRGNDKDKAVARRLLLNQVEDRHDARSLAIKKILKQEA